MATLPQGFKTDTETVWITSGTAGSTITFELFRVGRYTIIRLYFG